MAVFVVRKIRYYLPLVERWRIKRHDCRYLTPRGIKDESNQVKFGTQLYGTLLPVAIAPTSQ